MAADAAGDGEFGFVVADCDGDWVASAVYDHVANGGAFCADGGAVGGVLNVAARKDCSVFCQDGGAHFEFGIGGVGLFPGFYGLINEFLRGLGIHYFLPFGLDLALAFGFALGAGLAGAFLGAGFLGAGLAGFFTAFLGAAFFAGALAFGFALGAGLGSAFGAGSGSGSGSGSVADLTPMV